MTNQMCHRIADHTPTPGLRQLLDLPHGHVPRPRLTRFIDEPYQAPLTLVIAEPGTGKSTLLTEWALHASTDVNWVDLNSKIQTASDFALALLLALRSATGPDTTMSSPDDTRAALVETIRAMQHDVCVVIDNWDAVTDPLCSAIVEDLVSVEKPRLKLIISGRTSPSLRLGRMRAQGRVRELGIDDLLLTLPEAETIVRSTAHFDLSPHQVERLTSAADGWVAPLVLLGQAVHHSAASGTLTGFHENASTQVLDEYVEQEILPSVSPDIRDFALAIGSLPFLTPAICAATLGCDDCRDSLRALETGFPFVRRETNHPDRLRFHPLIGESLRRRSGASIPESIRRAHERRLAEWLIGAGELEEAARVALRMQNAANIAGFMHPFIRHLAERSQFEKMDQWLVTIPEAVFENHLDFAWWRFVTQAGMGRLIAAAKSLEELEPRAHANGTTLYAGRMQLARGGMATLTGLAPEGRDQLREALRHLPANAPTERMYATTMLGELAFRQGSDMEAARAFRQAEHYARQLPIDELWSWGILSPGRANGYAIRGDINSAITKYLLIIAEVPAFLAHTGIDSLVRCRLVSLYTERNDLEAARKQLDQLEAQMDDTLRAWHPEALVAKARLLLAEGHRDDAEEWASARLRELWRMPGKSQLVHLLARIWLERGEYSMVESWLTDTSATEPPGAHLFGDIDSRILAIDLSMAQGQFETAAKAAGHLAQHAAASRRWADVIALSSRQAIALHHLDEHDRAREVFRAAIDRGANKGFVRSYAVPGFDTITLFADLWSQNPVYQPVRRALRSLQTRSSSADVTKISKREREVLLLVAEGRTNQQIASAMFISTNTVRNHLVRICQRLEAHNRSGAVARARELGLLE